ncbi:MAG TPA: glycosyltransferase family 39 protein [Gemmatimonadales bacterium]|nr:glycosyltransferase family 39 protein [Gemmatimonadales bacterium]
MLLGLAANLGGYALLDPDEGRNASVAWEMAARGEWVVPRLNGLPYVDKPVLHFAATAASFRLFGFTERAARLPSLVFTAGTLTVLAWFAGRLLAPGQAWFAVIATASAPLTLGFARTVIFDATLTFFVVVALACFFHGIEGAGRRGPSTGGPWGWTAGAWAAVGLGILTKGPVALALPLMVAAPYAAWRGVSKAVWTPVGPLVAAAAVMPWLVTVSRDVPDLVAYAVVTETVERLFTPRLQRTEPVWYFLPVLVAGALPASAWVLAAGRRSGVLTRPDGSRDPRAVFLLLWIAAPLIFFSLSQSKRPQYVLPLVPAVALLAARLWQPRFAPGAQRVGVILAVVGGTVGLAPWLVPSVLDVSEGVRSALTPLAMGLGTATVAAGALFWLSRHRGELALIAVALPAAVIPLASTALMRQIARERSAALLAQAIEPALPPNGRVLAIGTFPLSLPFYLRRQVLLATDSGRELTSNYLPQRLDVWRSVPGTPLRPAEWWREAALSCGISVFVTRADDAVTRAALAARLPLLVETTKHAAYGPCGQTMLAGGR